MKLILSFSGRANGNCDSIADFISEKGDQVVYFRDLNAHPCSNCAYECFDGECGYRSNDIYALYESMPRYDKIVFIVPMYCGHPSSLYFIFNERGQDYFMHHDTYEAIISKLFIIGVCGREETTPDFIPCLAKWFDGSPYENRVLGIERHIYGQKLHDYILEVEELKNQIRTFMERNG